VSEVPHPVIVQALNKYSERHTSQDGYLTALFISSVPGLGLGSQVRRLVRVSSVWVIKIPPQARSRFIGRVLDDEVFGRLDPLRPFTVCILGLADVTKVEGSL
jgi:hypothetical protein